MASREEERRLVAELAESEIGPEMTSNNGEAVGIDVDGDVQVTCADVAANSVAGAFGFDRLSDEVLKYAEEERESGDIDLTNSCNHSGDTSSQFKDDTSNASENYNVACDNISSFAPSSPLVPPPSSTGTGRAATAAATSPPLQMIPPTPPVMLSSPSSPTAPTSPQSAQQTNFMKYGTIRPPVTILQEEFLQTYHLWWEYMEPLRLLESLPNIDRTSESASSPESTAAADGTASVEATESHPQGHSTSADVYIGNNIDNDRNRKITGEWSACMDTIRKLNSRYIHYGYGARQQHSYDQHGTFHPVGDALNQSESLRQTFTLAEGGEQKCEDFLCDENSLPVDAVVDKAVDAEALDDNSAISLTSSLEALGKPSSAIVNEKTSANQQIHQLLSALFRPGAKFSGSIELSNSQACTSSNPLRRHSRSQSQAEYPSPAGDLLTPGAVTDHMLSELRIFQSYELVIMEADSMDELGLGSKGILARHKVAGDEQCVFLKVSYVPIVENASAAAANSEKQCAASSSSFATEQNPTDPQLTIQMEYTDGEHHCIGRWNHTYLQFEGTIKKITEGNAEPNPMGGTIISGLINGRSSGLDESGDESDDGDFSNNGARNRGNRASSNSRRRRTAVIGKSEQSFTLSPCTHLHPRGVTPATSWKVNPDGPLRRHLSTQKQNNQDVDSVSGNNTTELSTTSIGFSMKIQKLMISPSFQKDMMEEIHSPENMSVIVHRARTEHFRGETIMKLVELGSIIDFAELARKRNVAKRREKWRKRFRKLTPNIPRRLSLRRGRTSTSSDLSKDRQSVLHKKEIPFYDHLAAIAWSDLLEEASIQTERICAIFRRRTALLDGLVFESDEYKAQVMSDLRTNGVSLVNTHAEWDTCIQMGRTVALAWSWFEKGSWGCFERSAVVGKRCVFLLFQMHSRLESNHDKFEKAYKSADARITMARLNQFTKRPTVAEDGDLVCAVCHCGMDDDEDDGDGEHHAVFLPCSHCFHWGCIREWLHNHSQCPTCRLDLNF